ncbi:LPS-assembly protein LptD [Methylovirgula sp. 4M-Z18]|nr:LPS-assembly protein LptD [Methylovirgula sp. 4M-Z18]
MLLAPALTPANAQTLSDEVSQRATPQKDGKQDRLALEANELDYDKDTGKVTAIGNVRLYYQGRTLEADKVIYDRNTKRVYAEGNAKMTEADGTVSYGDHFDLTDNFRDGFIESLRSITSDKTRMSAPHAERTDGETTVFDHATYTACEPCAEHPERPPLWQVRAVRITHKNEEQMVYYENATVDLLGVPVVWMPFLSAPDSTVSKKSGFLAPHYYYSTPLGVGVGIPYFWNLAPNYDLTLTGSVLSKQGFLGEVEWRHRLSNGSYTVRVSGIKQAEPSAFASADAPANGAPVTNRDYRGSLETTGLFYISDKWKYGWDATLLSDRYYIQDYKLNSESIAHDYFKESVSTAYLTGQGDRGYLDLRAYSIIGLTSSDIQKQQPTVGPLLDYNKSIDVTKERFGDTLGAIGGQITADMNAVNINRTLASYQTTLTPYQSYSVCQQYKVGSCLLNGVGGNYSRVSGSLEWKEKYTDSLGEVWTPFVFGRVDGISTELNTNSSFQAFNSSGQPISNSYQLSGNYFSAANTSEARAMGGVGLEYRYPWISKSDWGTQTIEPIGQIIVRPNSPSLRNIPNEDAQSLTFDDTNLFDYNKFSGYDRIEGGIRANVGAQYTATFGKGGYLNALFGQSYQVAGKNSYDQADVYNTGLDSGLNGSRSDYVSRLAFSPPTFYNISTSFIGRVRWDKDTFAPNALDASWSINYKALSFSTQYARYGAQPDLGYPFRREGWALNSRYNLTDHYYVSGGVMFDLGRHLYNNTVNPSTNLLYPNYPLFTVGDFNAMVGYQDDCTTFSLQYINALSDPGSGTKTHNQVFLVNLELRTLGDVKFKQSIGSDTNETLDGIASAH